MELSVNSLANSVAVILFPGIIATIICDKIAIHSAKWRGFKYAVYSFVFGVLSYLAVQVLYWVGQAAFECIRCQPFKFQPLHVWSLASSQQVSIDLPEVLFATIMAPLVAALATVINTRKVLTKWASRFRLSDKYGDENLFSYYLTTNDVQWVHIRDPSVNQTYEGLVWAYSETDNIQEVVLSDVAVYDYENSIKLYSLPSIYLARPIGTFSIEAPPAGTKKDADNDREADRDAAPPSH